MSFGFGFIQKQRAAAGGGTLVKTYKGGAAINNLGTSTRNFTAKDFGTASADRWILVLVSFRNSTARTLTGATIGGVTAAIIDQTSVVGSNGRLAWIVANVPTGTSGDINLTFSGNFVADTSNGAGINWYTIVGPLNTTPTDSYKSEDTADPAKTFTVPAGGVVFFGGTANNASRTITGGMTTDDFFTQFVAGGGRASTSYQDGGAGGTVSVGGSQWSTSGQNLSKLGYAFGPV